MMVMRYLPIRPLVTVWVLFCFTGCISISDILDTNNLGLSGNSQEYEDPRSLVESTRLIPISVRNQILEDANTIKSTLRLPGHQSGNRGFLASKGFLIGFSHKEIKNRWNDGISVNAMAQKYFPNDPKGADKVIDVISIYGNGKLKEIIRINSYRILESAYMHQAGEVPFQIGDDHQWNPSFDFGAEPALLFQYLNSKQIPDMLVQKEVMIHKLKEMDGIAKTAFFRAPYSGVAVEYHRNGRLKASYEYVNGKKEGIAAMWYRNGQQQHEMTYVDNRLNGKHFHWNPEGELVFEVDYIDGVAN